MNKNWNLLRRKIYFSISPSKPLAALFCAIILLPFNFNLFFFNPKDLKDWSLTLGAPHFQPHHNFLNFFISRNATKTKSVLKSIIWGKKCSTQASNLLLWAAWRGFCLKFQNFIDKRQAVSLRGVEHKILG